METDTPVGAERAEAIYDSIYLILGKLSLPEQQEEEIAIKIYDLVNSAYREGLVSINASLGATPPAPGLPDKEATSSSWNNAALAEKALAAEKALRENRPIGVDQNLRDLIFMLRENAQNELSASSLLTKPTSL